MTATYLETLWHQKRNFIKEWNSPYRPPLPLWRLKLTEDEYQQLKAYIRTEITHYKSLVFPTYRDAERLTDRIGCEVALLYAEYWRREYTGGSHEEIKVFETLGINYNENLFSLFKNSAKYGYPRHNPQVKSGWERLGMHKNIDIYTSVNALGNTIRSIVDSLFYQGGMPMQCIIHNNSPKWTGFVDSLLSDKVNFEELEMGGIASEVEGPISFCKELKNAFEENREGYHRRMPSMMKHDLMPFYCDNHYNEWFVAIMDKCLVSSTKSESKGVNPFKLKWMVDFSNDDIQTAYIYFRVTNTSHLSNDFLNSKSLTNKATQTFELHCGENTSRIYTYLTDSNGKLAASDCEPEECLYNQDETVSITCCENESIVLRRNIDITRPLALVPDYQGQFQILPGTNIYKAGRNAFRLLLPHNWELSEANSEIQTKTYRCNDEAFVCDVAFVPAGYHVQGISVKNKQTNEAINFIADSTEEELVINCSTYGPNAQIWSAENLQLIEISHSIFKIKRGDEEQEIASNLEFCSSLNTNNWHSKMPTGRILARVPNGRGEYIISNRFINIEGLKYRVLQANDETCILSIEMPHFEIEVEGGEFNPNTNEWTVDYRKLADKRSIKIKLLHMDPCRSFNLRLKSPFRVYAIYDAYGRKLENYDCIPVVDIPAHSYHIDDNQNNYLLRFGELRLRLTKDGNILFCRNLISDELRKLPFEGSLSLLLGDTSNITEPTALTLERLSVVPGAPQEHPFLKINVAKSPYMLSRTGNEITFSYQNIFHIDEESQRFENIEIEYNSSLTLVDVKDMSEVKITRQEDGSHIIPDELMDKGRSYIILGKIPGQIAPRFEDLSVDYTNQERRIENWNTTWRNLQHAYDNSRMFSPIWDQALYWYYLAIREQTEFKYFLDLKYIEQSPKLLAMFTWHLLQTCQTEEEQTSLAWQMINLFGGLSGSFIQMITSNDIIASLNPACYPNLEDLFDIQSESFRMDLQQWRLEHNADGDLSAKAYASFIWQKLNNLIKLLQS